MIQTSLLFFQLLLLMILLIIIGEPLRIVFSRYLSSFRDLDVLQASVLDVYLGGFILYVLAIVPLRLFSSTVSLGITIVLGLFSLFFHGRKVAKALRKFNPFGVSIASMRNYFSKHGESVLVFGIVVAMFLVSLWIQITPLKDFIFGSIHDTSLHGLFTQVIIENSGVPVTMMPYLAEGVIYPQGAHVVFAYASYVLDYSPPQTIFYITALFQALVILGAYYLGKAMHSRQLGVSFTFIFLTVSRWPQLLAWGGNPYIMAFPFQFICFSFVSDILNRRRQGKGKMKALELLVIGLLFGYLAALHLTLYIIVVASAAVLTLALIIYERKFSKLKSLLVVFGFSLIPISVFIGRFFIWWSYPGHNIGLPPDIVISPWPVVNVLSWILFYEGISPYPIIVVLVLGLVSVSLVTIYKMRTQLGSKGFAVEIALSSVLASIALFFLFNLQFVFPFLAIITGEAGRPTISLLIALYFCIAVFNVILYERVISRFSQGVLTVFNPSKPFFKKSAAILLSLLIFLLIYSPFLYYLTRSEGTLSENYALFAVTTRDDYDLMLWMKENLPRNAVVLVNIYEPGMFIPSLSHLKAVYPWVASKDSLSFQKLISMVRQGRLSTEVYEIMKQLSITHVYLGVRSTYWWEKNYEWDSQAFLGNPNFNLTKKVGDAYLFEVLYEEPNVVLKDSFEYEVVSDMGWSFISNTATLHNGTGQASTNSSQPFEGQRSLVLTAKKDSGTFYENWIYRNVYVWNSSNVVLNLYLNASAGFQPPDGINIYVSDSSWNEFIRFATPGQLFGENEPAVSINFNGWLSFDISQIWGQFHNSTLPNPFLLTIHNIDFDGVENVAFLDSVTVTIGD